MGFTITSNWDKNKLRRVVRSIPKYLSGEIRDQYKIGAAYKAFLAEALFYFIHKSLQQKAATGSADEFGDAWARLRKATIRYRKRASTIAKYPQAGLLQPVNLSGKLIASFSPGSVSFDGEYRAVKNQIALISNNKLTIGTKLEYATYQSAMRNLIPKDFQRLMAAAQERCLANFTEWLSKRFTNDG